MLSIIPRVAGAVATHCGFLVLGFVVQAVAEEKGNRGKRIVASMMMMDEKRLGWCDEVSVFEKGLCS